MFQKHWTTRQKASVTFEENELRLISKLEDVETIFPGLKNAVESANAEYLKSIEQAQAKNREAEEKAKLRKQTEERAKQNISSTLEKLK